MFKDLSNRARIRAASIAVLACSLLPALALADPGDPVEMGEIPFPIDMTSLGVAVATAGGLMLIAYFGIKIGFGLVKKLMKRLSSAV